jgi:Family of unknown function (DUF6084)
VAAAVTIPQLDFEVRGAERVEHAAVPTVRFALCVRSVSGEQIRSVLLDVQVQIAARRRAYDDAARERLFELFGPPSAWGGTLRTLLWTRSTVVVPPFTGERVVDLDVTCTYDLEVAGARYFAALEDGEIPLEFLFSGSVFFAGHGGALQTARIPWDREAEYSMPARVWREAIDGHFPGAAWLRLDRGTFDRLSAYRSRHALPTWEAALDALLAGER